MDAFSNAAVWDTIAQGKTIEGKSYGAAAMITDTESPPTSMAILPTPQQEVVEQTSLPAAFFKGFSCAACDAEDGLFDFCDACRRRAAMVRPPSASRPHVVFPLAAVSNGGLLTRCGSLSRSCVRVRAADRDACARACWALKYDELLAPDDAALHYVGRFSL